MMARHQSLRNRIRQNWNTPVYHVLALLIWGPGVIIRSITGPLAWWDLLICVAAIIIHACMCEQAMNRGDYAKTLALLNAAHAYYGEIVMRTNDEKEKQEAKSYLASIFRAQDVLAKNHRQGMV